MRTLADSKMPIFRHLAELRSRILWSLAAAAAGMVAVYAFYDPWVMWMLRAPLDTIRGATDNPFVLPGPVRSLVAPDAPNHLIEQLNLHFIGPVEVFMVKVKVSFFGGVIVASPFIFLQLWKFVSVGLMEPERKAVRSFFPVSIGLFLAGCAIAHAMVLPVMLYFLIVVSGSGLEPSIVISKYVSLVVFCCLGFGMVFQLPLALYVLARLGIVTPRFLSQKRRYAIVLVFVLAAAVTPTVDVVNQLLTALPLLVLYELGVVAARAAAARRRKAMARLLG